MNRRPIGVFDSGIGGLTVVRALTRRLPHENIVYFGDTARVPYGPKSPAVVREYAAHDVAVLMAHNVKAVVVACNTVSAVALDVVQNLARVPVIGMIAPGAAACVEATRRRSVGVIGTIATINSNAYAHAIRQLDPGVRVVARACPLFVPLAEEGWIDHAATHLIAKEYLFPLTLENIDTLILGCTHYPLLKALIAEVMGPGVTLVDSAEETAREVVARLAAEGTARTVGPGSTSFFVTDAPERFVRIGQRFLGARVESAVRIER
jgi:glutamate racemase